MKTTKTFTATCPNCGTKFSAEQTIVTASTKSTSQVTSSKSNIDKTATLDAIMDDPEIMAMFEKIATKIKDSGHIEVDGIVRRWIPSQCLQMLYSNRGFHQSLLDKGCNYSWDVVLADLKKQADLWVSEDTVGFSERNRWYNQSLVWAMCQDYLTALSKHIHSLPTYSCRGRKYIRFTCGKNNGRGLFVDQFQDFVADLIILRDKIMKASSPHQLLAATRNFNKARKKIRWYPKPSKRFINAYKAAGGYYTIKDLIMYEDCKIMNGSTFLTKEASLEHLDKSMEVLQATVSTQGYCMLGMLKRFAEYNNLDYITLKNKWRVQSQKRKIARKLANAIK